ncbi:MAG: hypothetical protein A3E36_02000 [Candidatus Andersenbacteria bacterium RIFCSPHIGHO2_12_FULL_45_11b]|uniref:Membrane protein 6-pyruvoyl-tetrahydropterin synthase-related domain-containing protein n=1 Tax=Candidatus Andersenbacteria bacterium RIFCSPHIGHO2_12_FULL_45_11b TaxID=1797282 RepID=A0A1G1X802_9BACT|nr:MAG: hypothetical protein A3E36_02000 [Candidatus Andersenbacteria bacterium RIFCSPHIGHO2_12_FULL_45_11b]
MTLNILKQHKIGLSAIFLTWFIFFVPIISGEYVYFLDDLKIIYYPIETAYAEFQHNWQLPLWANEFGFGQPLLGWGQLGFFTPLHLIMRALYIPPLALLQTSVVAYFLLGSIGMYAFLIRRNLHPTAATLGAIVFAYCGFSIGHLNHVNFYTSTMLLPWLLIAIDTLIKKPTMRRASALALIASAITMSGQPQVVLYTFIAATIIGLALFLQKFKAKTLLLTIYAGGIAFLLSSFAILPLQEFLPQTERAAGLPMAELYEFSYPPYAAITLILPYFFGDHAHYFGPKGFQELAAYTGIIPLILAGMALASWKTYRNERIAALALVLGGIALALGRYSPIYTYLVENHYITTIGVVGRFVFFFDIGIVLLAAIGLHDVLAAKTSAKKIACLIAGYATPLFLIALPAYIYSQYDAAFAERFWELFKFSNASWWLIAAGIILPGTLLFLKIKPERKAWLLLALAAGTLIWYGWDYNPRIPASEAKNPSPLAEDLMQFREDTDLPARLYAAEHLPVTGNPNVAFMLSEYISPLFTVIQPIILPKKNVDCLIVPIQADSEKDTQMTVTIQSGLQGKVYLETSVSSGDVYKNTDQTFCLPAEEETDNLFIKFSSTHDTNMKVFTTSSTSDEANLYFVRKEHPTEKQLSQSIKPLSVKYTAVFPSEVDKENALMVRHLQATAGASSARWIGALSIRPYREFIDMFLANDSEAFDGDGVHALTKYKTLVDMAGITHFIQLFGYEQTNDPMLAAGYKLVREADIGNSLIRLYENPIAYPKAFLSEHAQFIAANDEIRTHLTNPDYNPEKLIYVSGPTPPDISPADPSIPLAASAEIISYEQTRVDIRVQSNKEAFLVLNDASTEQWQTFIDGTSVPHLQANTIFKAAQVPAGDHIVSFRYYSPAVHTAKILSLVGIICIILTYAKIPRRNKKA